MQTSLDQHVRTMEVSKGPPLAPPFHLPLPNKHHNTGSNAPCPSPSLEPDEASPLAPKPRVCCFDTVRTANTPTRRRALPREYGQSNATSSRLAHVETPVRQSQHTTYMREAKCSTLGEKHIGQFWKQLQSTASFLTTFTREPMPNCLG